MAQPSAEGGIGDIVARLTHAWNSHDANAFAAVFRHDASFTNVFGIDLAGRAEIARGHARIFATMFRDSTLSFDPPRIRPLSPDLAWVALRWQMTGAYDPQGAPWPERHGLMNFVAGSQTDAWGIVALTNMDLPPPDQVAAMQKKLVSEHAS